MTAPALNRALLLLVAYRAPKAAMQDTAASTHDVVGALRLLHVSARRADEGGGEQAEGHHAWRCELRLAAVGVLQTWCGIRVCMFVCLRVCYAF